MISVCNLISDIDIISCVLLKRLLLSILMEFWETFQYFSPFCWRSAIAGGCVVEEKMGRPPFLEICCHPESAALPLSKLGTQWKPWLLNSRNWYWLNSIFAFAIKFGSVTDIFSLLKHWSFLNQFLVFLTDRDRPFLSTAQKSASTFSVFLTKIRRQLFAVSSGTQFP